MGRPSFQPKPEQRAQVEEWVKAKKPIAEMARLLDVAEKTFRKHFAAELGLIPVETVNTALAVARPMTSVFQPTAEQREQVLILAGARLSPEEIARKVGVTVPVLEEHFALELEQGPVKCKGDILQAMFFAGKGGNVAAAKVYLVFNGQEPAADGGTLQPAANGMIGKKEARNAAAQTAHKGSEWDHLVGDGTPN